MRRGRPASVTMVGRFISTGLHCRRNPDFLQISSVPCRVALQRIWLWKFASIGQNWPSRPSVHGGLSPSAAKAEAAARIMTRNASMY